MFFDTHTHYNNIKFDNIRNMILNSLNTNNIYALNVGCDIYSSQQSILLANNYDKIYAAIGIHPQYAKSIYQCNLIKTMISNNKKIVAIGEIGLDDYKLTNYDEQKRIFISQLQIAYEFKLPIILHIRNLYKECLEIINYYNINNGIIHCFSSNNPIILKQFLNNNFYISLSGNITFDNNSFQTIVNMIPENKLLIETDSPYLSPKPLRNKINSSFHIKYIAKKISIIKNQNIEYIYNITKINSFTAFNIKNEV